VSGIRCEHTTTWARVQHAETRRDLQSTLQYSQRTEQKSRSHELDPEERVRLRGCNTGVSPRIGYSELVLYTCVNARDAGTE
jgi:hypothetical protein